MALTRYRDVNENSSSSEYSDNVSEEISSRKLCFLFACLIFLGLLCLANSLVLAVMYKVLDIDVNGMSSIKFLKSESETKWVLDTDLEHILLSEKAEIDATEDGNLELLTARGQNLTLAAHYVGQSSIKLTPFETQMKTGHFEFVDADTGKSILDFDNKKQFSVHGEFDSKSLETNAIHTGKIYSENDDKPLEIAARDGGIFITGNKEILLSAGEELNMSSDEDLRFVVKNSINKISMKGDLKLNPSRIARSKPGGVVDTKSERYRLCACTKSGFLFRAKMENEMMTCAIARENPCPE